MDSIKKCIICNEREATILHHVNYKENKTIHVCHICHLKIHHKRLGENGEKLKKNIYLSDDKPYFKSISTTLETYEELNGAKLKLMKRFKKHFSLGETISILIKIERGDEILSEIEQDDYSLTRREGIKENQLEKIYDKTSKSLTKKYEKLKNGYNKKIHHILLSNEIHKKLLNIKEKMIRIKLEDKEKINELLGLTNSDIIEELCNKWLSNKK